MRRWSRVAALGALIGGCGLLMQACASQRRDSTSGWPAFGASAVASDPWESAAETHVDRCAASGPDCEVEESDGLPAADAAAALAVSLLAVALVIGRLAFPFLL